MHPGTKLGHYEVVDKLGEGGMGEVYRARDTRLKRDVAIKVLPERLARDADHVARLEREAQLLAALDHANVATVYGFGREDSLAYLVMELVPGTPLSNRMASGPVPWRETLAVGIEMALGLEAAHDGGIVHRDLKPANVHVDDDGHVKVLDFGLAKPFEAGPANHPGMSESPTLSVATHPGVIMGTAAYMSPEQARGKRVDKRTDVWALGCVLYELLAGQKAFRGDTVSDILASILKDDPDFDCLPPVPVGLRRLLRRCLMKDPSQRTRDIGDVRIEMEALLEGEDISPRDGVAGRISTLVVLSAAAGALALGVFIGFALWGSASPRWEQRAILATESFARGPTAVVISPDGRFVAETTADAIRVRRADDVGWLSIPDSSEATATAFSADSQRLLFTRGTFAPETTLHSASIEGSSPVLEATMTGGLAIVFRGHAGATMVSISDRPRYTLDELETDGSLSRRAEGELLEEHAALLITGALGPDRWIGWMFNDRSEGSPRIVVVGAGDAEPVYMLEGYRSPLHLGGGRILVVDGDGRLFSAKVDLSTGALVEPPSLRLEGMALSSGTSGAYGVSVDGTLVFLSGPIAGGTALAWLDGSGAYEILSERRGSYQVDSRVSPDGTRLALEVEGTSVLLHDIARDVPTPLVPGVQAAFPVWSPDSKHIAYYREGDGLYRAPADRSAAPNLLASPPDGRFYLPMDWSPDGEWVLYVDSSSDTREEAGDNDLWLIPAEGGEPRAFLQSGASEVDGRFSPDGRFVAYQSDQSGRNEVFVRALAGGGELQISADGGFSPEWSQSGLQLFFERDREIRVVDIDTRGDVPAVSPERLLTEFPSDVIGDLWHPHPGGDRFLVSLRAGATEGRPEIHVIFNWSFLDR